MSESFKRFNFTEHRTPEQRAGQSVAVLLSDPVLRSFTLCGVSVLRNTKDQTKGVCIHATKSNVKRVTLLPEECSRLFKKVYNTSHIWVCIVTALNKRNNSPFRQPVSLGYLSKAACDKGAHQSILNVNVDIIYQYREYTSWTTEL